MSERNLKIYINKKITPLILISEQYTKYPLRDLIIEVDQKTLKIMNEIKDKHSLTQKEQKKIEEEISFLLSQMIVYQVEVNDNIFLDDFVSYIIEVINIDINQLITEREDDKLSLFLSVKKSLLEINKFHDTLFFAEIINIEELQDITSDFIKSILEVNYEIINYLKKNKNNDIEYIYSITNFIDEIYSSILKNLFDFLMNNEKNLKKYKENYAIHINKAKELFIERYSTIIHLNDKYYKKIQK